MRVLRYQLRRGSRGFASRPMVRASNATCSCSRTVTVSLITEQRVSQPWGLAGGGPGATGENLLPRAMRRAPSDCPIKCTIRLRLAMCGCRLLAEVAGGPPLCGDRRF